MDFIGLMKLLLIAEHVDNMLKNVQINLKQLNVFQVIL